jgi:hypothetical protein
MLEGLRRRALAGGKNELAVRLAADIAYLRALLGERCSLNEYVRATQGAEARGWPQNYVDAVGSRAREALKALGIAWGPGTLRELVVSEGAVGVEEAASTIRAEATRFEHAVRALTGATALFDLHIELADTDAYWRYWLDGAGNKIRLRLNLRHAQFTRVTARQFALHEVLGHGLQSVSFARTARISVTEWPRVLSVHCPTQICLEGLAQALPLFVAPDDEQLIARAHLNHFQQLVNAQMHISINNGSTMQECSDYARARVPFWSEEEIADALLDRRSNPQLRSYLWAYPAGVDWFSALASADPTTIREVFHAAYQKPLAPFDLRRLWPEGPPIGGPGGPIHLRDPALP